MVGAEDLLPQLQSSPQGLSSAQARARRAAAGPNRLCAGGYSTRDLLLRQLGNPLAILLLAAAGLSWLLGQRADAWIIFSIVAASGVIGFEQERSAGAAARALLRLVALRATVLRDGRSTILPVEELVPGDIVDLRGGTLVPADARLLEAENLYVDESSLTGEAFPAEKTTAPAPAHAPVSARTCALFLGTHVVSGHGRAVIVSTGAATEFAHVAERLRRRAPVPQFERGLQQFGSMLVRVTLALFVVIFALTARAHGSLLEALMFALALSVGMTPELLPAIVTVNLARGARRMARRKVVVKRLDAIENFGSMDVLCADKTGTLTEGTVRVDGAWDAGGCASDHVLELAAINAALQAGFSSPIDAAVVAAARPPREVRKLDEVPYDFSRKRLSVLVEGAGGHRRLVTKGAYASVLAACSSVSLGGRRVPLDHARAGIEHAFESWSEQGLRVLGVAERDMGGCSRATAADEAAMTLAGFLTLSDTPKPGIQAAIERLQAVGVRLKIITGDNPRVAAAVARQVGMRRPRIVTGTELRRLSQAGLCARAETTDVFAEVEPNQKERIILALKKNGSVVGFLGDGINDAPALHAADVGISVEGAADVAKEAADIVLLDKELAVLTEGVLQGRQTFVNTLKYIYITTSANFGNMLSMALAAPLLPFLPLLPKQILLNNFLSDVPALTIGADRVDEEALRRPQHWNVRAIRDFMLLFGTISSLFDGITFALLLGVLAAGAGEFRSAWFLVSLMTELCILLVMRTRRPLLRSLPSAALALASGATAAVAVAIVFSPAAALLGFAAPRAAVIAACVLVTLAYAAASEAAKHWFFARSRYRESRGTA